jgi:hypothetical protein
MKKLIFFYAASLSLYFLVMQTGCSKDESPVINNNQTSHFPSVPSNPVPPNDTALSPGTAVTLRWDCTDADAGDTIRYTIYMGQANPPTVVLDSNLLLRAYDFGMPSPGPYFWKIKARDLQGNTSFGPIWKFTVNP